jgi:gliding motility-associated-like protein
MNKMVHVCYLCLRLMLEDNLRYIFSFSFFIFLITSLQGQPAPCNNGTQATCRCNTAPILCSVEELDGYEFSMSTFQHPADGPNPLCSGTNNVPNNPTWFAFIAWCTNLTLEAELSNCSCVLSSSNGTPCPFPCPSFGCTRGAQIAIFGDCNYNEQVACNVADCGNQNTKQLVLNNLTVGKTYYFMIDGCAGSACDVKINVVGACGISAIEPWTNPIDGPTRVCPGTSHTFSVDNLAGAVIYHWFLNNVEIAQTSTPTLDIDFNIEGIFELCVDVSNPPCIPITDLPNPLCMFIEVRAAIPIDPQPVFVCSGEFYEYSDNGEFYPPGIHPVTFDLGGGCDSTITLVVNEVASNEEDLGIFFLCEGESIEVGGQEFSAPGDYTIPLVQVNPPFCDSTITFLIVPIDGDAGSLIISSSVSCPGDNITIQTQGFNNTGRFTQFVLVTDASGIVLALNQGNSINFVASICGTYIAYSYNADLSLGNVAPLIGTLFDQDYCLTGCCAISRLEFQVDDTIPPVFSGPPIDITVQNPDLIPEGSTLSWSDNCGESGTADFSDSGTADLCDGGLIIRTWEARDICGNMVIHQQRITVLPNPDLCVDPCTILVDQLIIGNCNNNNTGNVDDDDLFSILFQVISTEGVISQVILNINGNTIGPFDYNTLISIADLPANGQEITIIVRDTDNPVCRTQFVVSQSSCSSCPQTVSAGLGGTITCDNQEVTLQGSASEPGIFSWTGPDGFTSMIPNPTVDRPGIYNLTVSFPFGCEFMDTVEVTEESDIPIADAGIDRILNCITSEVTLGGSQTSTYAGLRYEWRDANNNLLGTDPLLAVNLPGAYTLRVFDDGLGCTSSPSTVIVSQNLNIPSANIILSPGDQINCLISEIAVSTSEEPNVIYNWFLNGVPQEFDTIWINRSTFIELVATDTLSLCTNSDSLTISEALEYPLIQIQEPNVLTCDRTSVFINASNSQVSNSIIHQWILPGGDVIDNATLSIEVFGMGVYQLIATDTINGCTNIDSINVRGDFVLPLVDAGTDQSFNCNDGISEFVLTGETDGALSNRGVLWMSASGLGIVSGANSLMPLVNLSGVYILEITNLFNGCQARDSVEIRFNDNQPEIYSLHIEDINCPGDVGVISVIDFDGGNEPFTITLNGQTSPANNTFGNLSPGVYQVRLEDALGCFVDTTVIIRSPSIFTVDLPNNSLINQGDSLLLAINTTLADSLIGNITWQPEDFVQCPSCPETLVFPWEPTTFSVVVTDIFGCISEASVDIFVRKRLRIYIPNAFTPNGDGTNDKFNLFSDRNVSMVKELSIFDRWGTMVYYEQNLLPNDTTQGWDGRVNGRLANPGVYVYYFVIELADGTIETRYGDVTLLSSGK